MLKCVGMKEWGEVALEKGIWNLDSAVINIQRLQLQIRFVKIKINQFVTCDSRVDGSLV
jgi:hypothetical protein